MCGIFAVVSKDNKFNTAKVVLNGLKKLEYRGYDSWGIVVREKDKLIVDKHIGKIANASTTLSQSSIGLGHTRWATHGGVTIPNAHPFLDCNQKIALVHNGIIDNYLEIKINLKKKHTFKSQTDSEVLLHLIEELSETTASFYQAVRHAFSQAKGLNAILAISQSKVVAAKTGSPLVVGIGKNRNFIASDLWSILDHTQKVVFLEDGEMVEISSKQVNFFNIKTGKSIKPKIQTINWHQESASLNNHPHFMIKEITEQPQVIERLLIEKQPQTKQLANLIKKSKVTFFVACGTAAYAAIAAQYFFSKIAQTHTNPAIGSEFIYCTDFINQKTLVIALSQSGETIDTIQSVNLAQKKGATVVCLVNVLGSTLYRISNKRVLLDCGPEKAVASTKAFIAKIVLLLMTVYHMNGKLTQGLNQLKKAKIAVEEILSANYRQKIKKLAEKIKSSNTIFVVGRGFSYPAALEAALKIKEISYIHAEGLAGGELKHGVIALVEKGTPCIVIAPDDETYHDSISGAMEMKARGGFIIGITSKSHEVFDITFKVKNCGSASIIPNVIISQLFAYELALARDLDPDKPRNLAKSVTVK